MNVLLSGFFVVYECGINISIIFSTLFHYYRIYYYFNARCHNFINCR
jgi:hypothetical protein